MQELKMQNGLLLQLVKGLQNQINSKNRENHILFQQYEQLAADNSAMRAQIDSLRSKQREQTLESHGSSPRQQEQIQLKQKIAALEQHIKELVVELDQKGGSIILLQSQLKQLKSKLIVYQKQKETETKAKNERKYEIRKQFVVSIFNLQSHNQSIEFNNQFASKIEGYQTVIRQKQQRLQEITKQNAQLKENIIQFDQIHENDRKVQENLNKNIEQLKAILASKEQSIVQLGQFLSALSTKSQEAAEKQQQLENNLKQALTRMITIEQENDTLKSQLVQAKQEKQRSNIQQLNALSQIENFSSATEVDEAYVRLSTKQDQLLRAKQIQAEKDQTIAQCFERINQLTEKVQQLENLLPQSGKQEQLARLQQTLKDKQQVVSQCFQRINQLTEKIQQLEVLSMKQEPNQQMQQTIKTKDETIAGLSQYLNEQLKSISELNSKVNQLEEFKLRENPKDKQQIIEVHVAKIGELQQIIKSKEESLAEMSAYIEENNLRSARLQDNHNSLIQQNQALQEKIKNQSQIQQNAKNNQSDETKQKIKELQQKIQAKQLIISQFNEFINEQTLRVTSLEQQKNQALKEQNDKYEEIVLRTKGLEDLLRQKEEVRQQLIAQLELKEKESKELSSQNSELKSKKQIQNNFALLKIKQFQQKLAKEDSLIILLTQKIQDLQKRQFQLQKELQQVASKYTNNNDLALKEKTSNQSVQKQSLEQKLDVVSGSRKIQDLEATIAQLQSIINSKSDTIAELSQFMNEQATTIAQLQAKIENSSIQLDQSSKISDLQAIIKLKQQSVQELRQYLEENAAKVVELQARNAELQSQAKKTQETAQNQQKQLEITKKQQEFVEKIEDLQRVEAQKKQIIVELQLTINHKKLELENYKIQYLSKQREIQEMEKNIQSTKASSEILANQCNQLSININKLMQFQKDLSTKKQSAQILLRDLLTQTQVLQNQIIQRQLELQAKNNHAKEEPQWQILFNQKQMQINALSQILQKLQDQLRSKNQIIQYLQEKESGNSNVPKSTQQSEKNQPENKINAQEYQERVRALESQNQILKAQHKQLTQRLDALQKSNLIQQKYDLISMERQLGLQSKIVAQQYKKQLQGLKQIGEIQPNSLNQQNVNQEQQINQQEKALTTREILSQLLIYSQGGSSLKEVKNMLHSLNLKYLTQIQASQAEKKSLKQELAKQGAAKDNLSKKISELKTQIYQLNQQITEKNQLIESLHELNGEKEKSFNDKIEQIRSSFQVTGNQFCLNFISKQIQNKTQAIVQQQVVDQQLQALKNENKELKELVKQLREEIQILGAENKIKGQQLQSLRQKRSPTIQKEFDDLLRDSNSNMNEEAGDSRQQIERLILERESLIIKYGELEGKLEQMQNESKRAKEEAETLKKQINQHICETTVPSDKVLQQLYQKKQSAKQESYASEERDQIIVEKLLEKNEIIAELQETVLKLQKGYNAEIMQLRKNNAQLNAQILSLTKKIYLMDPNAVDVTEYIKESCRQAVSQTQYYKSRYNLKFSSHYRFAEQPHNLSYLTQQHSRTRRYQPFFTHKDMNLGEKIIGRPCRVDPLNYTMNNDFKLNYSAWEMQGGRPI